MLFCEKNLQHLIFYNCSIHSETAIKFEVFAQIIVPKGSSPYSIDVRFPLKFTGQSCLKYLSIKCKFHSTLQFIFISHSEINRTKSEGTDSIEVEMFRLNIYFTDYVVTKYKNTDLNQTFSNRDSIIWKQKSYFYMHRQLRTSAHVLTWKKYLNVIILYLCRKSTSNSHATPAKSNIQIRTIFLSLILAICARYNVWKLLHADIELFWFANIYNINY